MDIIICGPIPVRYARSVMITGIKNIMTYRDQFLRSSMNMPAVRRTTRKTVCTMKIAHTLSDSGDVLLPALRSFIKKDIIFPIL